MWIDRHYIRWGFSHWFYKYERFIIWNLHKSKMYSRKCDSWHYGIYIGENEKCALLEKCLWGIFRCYTVSGHWGILEATLSRVLDWKRWEITSWVLSTGAIQPTNTMVLHLCNATLPKWQFLGLNYFNLKLHSVQVSGQWAVVPNKCQTASEGATFEKV